MSILYRCHCTGMLESAGRLLKKRLIDEGANKTVTECNGLKIIAQDGKMTHTDVADTETMLRFIQTIPSQNAEPFKRWHARVGYEILEENATTKISENRELNNLEEIKIVEKFNFAPSP